MDRIAIGKRLQLILTISYVSIWLCRIIVIILIFHFANFHLNSTVLESGNAHKNNYHVRWLIDMLYKSLLMEIALCVWKECERVLQNGSSPDHHNSRNSNACTICNTCTQHTYMFWWWCELARATRHSHNQSYYHGTLALYCFDACGTMRNLCLWFHVLCFIGVEAIH